MINSVMRDCTNWLDFVALDLFFFSENFILNLDVSSFRFKRSSGSLRSIAHFTYYPQGPIGFHEMSLVSEVWGVAVQISAWLGQFTWWYTDSNGDCTQETGWSRLRLACLLSHDWQASIQQPCWEHLGGRWSSFRYTLKKQCWLIFGS